jgi:transposase
LVEYCREQRVELVAMEASGGYERKVMAMLWAEGMAVALLNPRAVRQFARGMGTLEKTDRIDARMIAWYAEVKRSEPGLPASAAQQRLKALVTRLRQLTEMAAGEKNKRCLVRDELVEKSFSVLRKTMQAEVRRMEEAIVELLESDPMWRKLDEALRSIKGVAGRTVARVLAEMPEIGTLSNKAVSKLAGLAPMAEDSGKHEGKRVIRGGRRNVRAILYIVAGVVAKYNADFGAFAARLAAAGKPKKVIRVAMAHKLLVRLNARARDARRAFACDGVEYTKA